MKIIGIGLILIGVGFFLYASESGFSTGRTPYAVIVAGIGVLAYERKKNQSRI